MSNETVEQYAEVFYRATVDPHLSDDQVAAMPVDKLTRAVTRQRRKFPAYLRDLPASDEQIAAAILAFVRAKSSAAAETELTVEQAIAELLNESRRQTASLKTVASAANLFTVLAVLGIVLGGIALLLQCGGL